MTQIPMDKTQQVNVSRHGNTGECCEQTERPVYFYNNGQGDPSNGCESGICKAHTEPVTHGVGN